MDSNTITKIVEILMEDSIVATEWLELYHRLGLSPDIESMKQERKDGTLNFKDLFRNIIGNWISEKGSNGSVELCQVLEQMKRFNASQNIQAALNINTARSTKPIFFGFERMSKNFTGRCHQIDEIEKVLTDTGRDDFVKIIGMGGIGKTELAKKFAYQHKQWNCIWLNAENAPTLQTSVTKFCKTLGITDGSIKFIDLFQSCLETIQKKNSFKVLVIVDNVDADYDQALGVIRVIKVQPHCFAIVTSRNVGVMGFAGDATINLRTLANGEAIQLVRSSLEGERDQDILSLCQQLDNFPLSLQQAVAFIKQKQIRGVLQKSFKIPQYLEQYEIEKKKLLNFPLVKLEHKYSKTTLITWQTSIDAIKAEGKVGKISIDLLNIIAYMEADEIPVQFIKKIYEKFEGSTDQVIEAIELLIDYFLVRVQSKKISVHRLVQEVVRVHLTKCQVLEQMKRLNASQKIKAYFNINEAGQSMEPILLFGFGRVSKNFTGRCKQVDEIENMLSDDNKLVFSSLEGESDQDISSLCEELENIPWALELAVAFIKQKQLKGVLQKSFKIPQYRKHYEIEETKLLNYPLAKLEHKYGKPTLITLQTSTAAIKAEGNVGKISIDLLNIITYMEADEIPVQFIKMIYEKFEGSTDQVIEAIELLLDYSLVRVQSKKISVKRLVQEVVRNDLADNKVLIKLISVVDEVLKSSVGMVEEQTHVYSVWRYFSQLQDDNLERRFMSNRINLINKYFLLRRIEDKFYRDSVETANRVLGKDNKQTLIITSRFATFPLNPSICNYDIVNVEILNEVFKKQTEMQEEGESVITGYVLCFTFLKFSKDGEAVELLKILQPRVHHWTQFLFLVVERLSSLLKGSGKVGDAAELGEHVLKSVTKQEGVHSLWVESVRDRISNYNLYSDENTKKELERALAVVIRVFGQESQEVIDLKSEIRNKI